MVHQPHGGAHVSNFQWSMLFCCLGAFALYWSGMMFILVLVCLVSHLRLCICLQNSVLVQVISVRVYSPVLVLGPYQNESHTGII